VLFVFPFGATNDNGTGDSSCCSTSAVCAECRELAALNSRCRSFLSALISVDPCCLSDVVDLYRLLKLMFGTSPSSMAHKSQWISLHVEIL